MNSTRKFYLDFTIVVLMSALCAWLTSRYIMQSPVPISFWLCAAFISLVTLIIHRILIAAHAKRPSIFVAYFMGALTGKLLLSAVILLIVGLTDPVHLMFTGVGFFILYVLLTVVELIHLLQFLRSPNN